MCKRRLITHKRFINPLAIIQLVCRRRIHTNKTNKASQAIQSPRAVPFFLLISLLDGYSFANAHVKNIVAFKHVKKQ